MDQPYVFCITEHRIYGLIILPYNIEKQKYPHYFTLGNSLTTENYKGNAGAVIKLLRICREYHEKTIFKTFSRKQKDIQAFNRAVDKEFVTRNIRPYIERRLVKIIDLLIENDMPLFFRKKDTTNIYPEDEIKINNIPAETVFNFTRHSGGLQYFLSVKSGNSEMKLTGKKGIILTNDPCRLILENTLHSFLPDPVGIDGKKLLPFFSKEFIPIPGSAEKKYFETFIFNAVEKFNVRSEGFEITEEQHDPEVVLSLENDLEGMPAILLKFDYGNKRIFYAGNEQKIHVTYTGEAGNHRFIKLIRNKKKELAVIQNLIALGLINKQASLFSLPVKGISAPESTYDLITWINEHDEQFAGKGYKIIQDYFTEKYNTGKAGLNINLNKQRDWFDIFITVTVGEYKIPFVRFRDHIICNIREYRLPNGDLFILPAGWFEKYRELFYFSEKSGEKLQVKHIHYKILEDLPVQEARNYLDDFMVLQETSLPVATDIPAGLAKVMRPYQFEGYCWLHRLEKNNFNGCLADDMGLGKTIQALSILLKDPAKNKTTRPGKMVFIDSQQLSLFDLPVYRSPAKKASLIIVPTSLVHNWVNEINKFAPSLKYTVYTGPERMKTTDVDYIHKNFDVILTSYGIVRNDLDKLKNLHFNYLILDESQNIKNPESKIYQAVTRLNSDHRLVLTGTPIENSLNDLWAQMNFLNPGFLGTIAFFNEKFVGLIEKKKDERANNKLKALIQPFILRRTKNEVEPDLPPLSEQTIYCEMTGDHKAIYDTEKNKVRNFLLEKLNSEKPANRYIIILNAITRLRQIANHPVMIYKDYLSDSGKYEQVTSMLENVLAEKHKVLVVSSFVKHLRLFSGKFDKEGLSYSILTGATRNREEVIRQFQDEPARQIFLISLKAGGFGLNLTAADYVFILDPWWNPASEKQAMSRAHRIGQDKKVFVYRFISTGTIEEKIEMLKAEKSSLFSRFIDNNNPFKLLDVNEILQFI
jgi:SNF2 family DNA or RNA helicase